MTAPDPQQPPLPHSTDPHPEAPPQKPRWPWMFLAGVFGLLLLIESFDSSTFVPDGGASTTGDTYAAERAKAIAESEAWYARWSASASAPPPAPLPSPSDFTIGVNVLEKKCFGSAGCNVSYQIEPEYVGATSLDGNTFTVIYEVTGGEDGPQINNFKVSDGTMSFQREENTSTSSSGAILTAKATGISEN